MYPTIGTAAGENIKSSSYRLLTQCGPGQNARARTIFLILYSLLGETAFSLLNSNAQEIIDRVYLNKSNLGILMIPPEDPGQIRSACDKRGLKRINIRKLAFYVFSIGSGLHPRVCERYDWVNIPLPGLESQMIAVWRGDQRQSPEAKRYLTLLREESLKVR